MLIQAYVENAIKHGLMQKTEGGKVWIKISQTDNGEALTKSKFIISIEDHGIGMTAASKTKNRIDSTGKGMRINRQIFDLLDELYKYKIVFSVEKLIDNDKKDTGTRIVLELSI